MILNRSAGSLSVLAALALWLSLATTQARADLFVGCKSACNGVLEYNGTTGAFVTAFVGAGSGGLNNPSGLVFGPNGNLFVTSVGTGQVLEYNGTTGAFVTAFVGAGSGGLNNPSGLVFGPNGNLFVTSVGTAQVLEYNGTTGAFVTAFVGAGSGGLGGPAAWCSGLTAISSWEAWSGPRCWSTTA